MFVVARFDVDPQDTEGFLDRCREALAALADRPGYRNARLGRSVDEPTTWTLVTDWDGVGAYRRALSTYDVKVRATPLLALARDEPSVFEALLYDDGGPAVTVASDRARDRLGPGERGDHAR